MLLFWRTKKSIPTHVKEGWFGVTWGRDKYAISCSPLRLRTVLEVDFGRHDSSQTWLLSPCIIYLLAGQRFQTGYLETFLKSVLCILLFLGINLLRHRTKSAMNFNNMSQEESRWTMTTSHLYACYQQRITTLVLPPGLHKSALYCALKGLPNRKEA